MATLKDINLLDVGHSIQLAGAVYTSDDTLYLVMLPDEQGEISNVAEEPHLLPEGVRNSDDLGALTIRTLDLSQEDWVTFIRQTDLLETEVLTQAGVNAPIVKAILRKSTRQIEQGVSWEVYRRDSYRCRYCAADNVPLTVDHLVLWEQGGPSTKENLVSCCRKCNKVRADTPYDQWLQHPFYLKVSQNLTAEARQANEALLTTLDAIPRRLHRKAR